MGAERDVILARCAAACRTVLRLCVVLLVAWAIHLMIGWVSDLSLFESDHLRVGMLILFLLVYMVLIAVPFVPGVEIGLSLMMMEGPWIAPYIYLSTVAGLGLAYAAGERLPYPRLRRMFEDLHLRRACRLIDAVEPLDRAARLQRLHDSAPVWLRPLVSRFRYVMIAVLVNMPGSALIGGGGGILFSAGLSHLFQPCPMLLTLLIAVAPVPLCVWVFGIDIGWIMG